MRAPQHDDEWKSGVGEGFQLSGRLARGLRLWSANPDDCFDHLPIAESHERIGDKALARVGR